MKVLFVTWDGPQVSYVEGLFLPIFERLHCAGLQFHVLQFTWGDAARVEVTRKACEAAGVAYRATPVLRRPVGLGAMLTAFAGARQIRRAANEWSIDILMPRSNLPAVACLLAHWRMPLPMVFDADGLPLDERVDFAGSSPSAPAHRFLRDVEAEMVRRADRVLTRSQRAIEILIARGGAGTAHDKFYVVGNGRDAEKFCPGDEALRRNTRQELGIDEMAPLLVYAGSLGKQYCLNEMLQLLEVVTNRRADARLLILSCSPEIARAALSTRPTLNAASVVMSVSANEVPRYLACADLGLALRRPSFSMQAVAPTKIGEYLLCGLPVVATKGVGDTDMIGRNAGFLLERMDRVELERVADWFCDSVLQRRDIYTKYCREIGLYWYSLDGCVRQYLSAYQGIFV